MTEEKALKQMQQGSQEALCLLIERYTPYVSTVIHNIIGSSMAQADIEETTADVFFTLWQNAKKVRVQSLKSYLAAVARNLALKKYQYNTAAKRSSTYDVALDEIAEIVASANTVEQEIETQELTRMLEAYMDGLSQENRVIFMRRYWYSDSYEDIAAQVGLTVKNVSVRLVRMRKALRTYLAERGVTV